MTTTLRILGWRAEGLRCPDHTIDFLEDRDCPFAISLIQMPNGTGKTTTLKLLRTALSGSLVNKDLHREEVAQFKKQNSDSDHGFFEVRLQLNKKPLTIGLDFDFIHNVVDYKTTWKKRGGQNRGFEPPRSLRRFMNQEFVNFYVFDGELAEDLLDHRKTNAGTAIESLFQVHRLENISDAIGAYWERVTKDKGARNQAGLTTSKGLLEKWSARLAVLEKEESELIESLELLDSNIAEQEEKYKEEIAKEETREEKSKEARTRVELLQAQLEETTKSSLEIMRNPHALSPIFSQEILNFKSGLDRVKLPESAAREWFDELANEVECVCGRAIDESIRKIIKNNAEKYLGSDNIILLNKIKSDISDAIEDSAGQLALELDELLSELEKQSEKHKKAEFDLEIFLQEMAETDPSVKEAKEEMDRLKEERILVSKNLEKYQNEPDISIPQLRDRSNEIFCVKTAREMKDRLEEEVAERTETFDLKRKRDILIRIVNEAREKAKLEIADTIRDRTNQRIEHLMPNNEIRVHKIENALLLHGQKGGSAGENLSVGYAFLSTLFNRKNYHELPFVVDTPVAPIDGDIRSTIGELLPKLTGQVIAFMISTEREGFLSSLKEASEGDIQYITLFRKNAGYLENRILSTESLVQQTTDGCRVTGEEFFDDFQQDDESEVI